MQKGKFGDKIGAGSCDSCAAGQFTAAKKQILCSECSAGRYQSATGQSFCPECEEGTYRVARK